MRRSIAATLHDHARGRFAEQTGSAPIDERTASAGRGHFALRSGGGWRTKQEVGRGLRVLAQLHRTFIVATDGEASAAGRPARRARTHRLRSHRRPRRRSASPSEPLLVPQVMELDAARSAALDARSGALREGGLEIESFGERTYRIVATPAGYGARTFDLGGTARRFERGAQSTRRSRTGLGFACVSQRDGRRRTARAPGDDDAGRASATLRESDALPARPSDDGAFESRRDRAHVQACLTAS